MRIKFDKLDGFIETYDGVRDLVLFGYWWYDKIFDNIKCLINEQSGNTDSINLNFARIRIDSCNSLLIEKALTFHNVVILIKSVFSKNKNYYYYNIFLEKG